MLNNMESLKDVSKRILDDYKRTIRQMRDIRKKASLPHKSKRDHVNLEIINTLLAGGEAEIAWGLRAVWVRLFRC